MEREGAGGGVFEGLRTPPDLNFAVCTVFSPNKWPLFSPWLVYLIYAEKNNIQKSVVMLPWENEVCVRRRSQLLSDHRSRQKCIFRPHLHSSPLNYSWSMQERQREVEKRPRDETLCRWRSSASEDLFPSKTTLFSSFLPLFRHFSP
jgi:hypothetical protein